MLLEDHLVEQLTGKRPVKKIERQQPDYLREIAAALVAIGNKLSLTIEAPDVTVHPPSVSVSPASVQVDMPKPARAWQFELTRDLRGDLATITARAID